jgi:hypothetical protein
MEPVTPPARETRLHPELPTKYELSLILALLLLGIPGALCLAIGAWHFVVPDKVDQGAVIGPSFGGAMSLGALLVLTRGLAWYRLSRRENLAPARPAERWQTRRRRGPGHDWAGDRPANSSRCGTGSAQLRLPGSDAAEAGVLGQDGSSPWLRVAGGSRRNVSDGSSPKQAL